MAQRLLSPLRGLPVRACGMTLLLVFVALLAGADRAAAAVPWNVDLAQAKAASQISRRPILILFVADWSEASVNHEKTFLGTEEAVALLTACFEPVKIDINVDTATPVRLDVAHIPCACVIDVEERVLARFDCPESSAAFVAAAGRAAQAAAVACAGPLPPPPAAATVPAAPMPAPDVAATSPFPVATPAPQAAAPAPAPAPTLPSPAQALPGPAPTPESIAQAPTTAAAPWPAEATTAPLSATPAPAAAAPAPAIDAPAPAVAPHPPAAAAPTWLDQPAPTSPPPSAAAPAPTAKKPSGFWAAVQKPFGGLVGKPAKPAEPAVTPAEIPSTGVPGADPGASTPVGLEGYCPVTLVEKGKWTEGRAKWGVRHRGRTWLCAGPDEQRAFLANPDRFAPGLSGDDPVLAFDSGKKVPGQRQYGVSYRSKIYLFSSPDTQAAFKVDPQKYAQRVQVAEQATGAATVR